MPGSIQAQCFAGHVNHPPWACPPLFVFSGRHPTGTIHPPPNSNPGASEAKNTAVRSLASFPDAFSNADCNVAPHIEEPRFPLVTAIGGNALVATPNCFASRATSRGFG